MKRFFSGSQTLNHSSRKIVHCSEKENQRREAKEKPREAGFKIRIRRKTRKIKVRLSFL